MEQGTKCDRILVAFDAHIPIAFKYIGQPKSIETFEVKPLNWFAGCYSSNIRT